MVNAAWSAGSASRVSRGPAAATTVSTPAPALVRFATEASSAGVRSVRPASVRLAGVKDAVDLAIAFADICARTKSGAVACVDLGDDVWRTLPPAKALVEISDVRGAAQLDGNVTVCALLASGTTACLDKRIVKGKMSRGFTPTTWYRLAQSRLVRFAETGVTACGVTAEGQIICHSQNGGLYRGGGESPVSRLPLEVAFPGGAARQ